MQSLVGAVAVKAVRAVRFNLRWAFAAVLVTAVSVLGTTPAHAAVGDLSLSPSSGPTSTADISYSTSTGCPAGFQGSASVQLIDPGTSQTLELSPWNNSVTTAFSGTLDLTWAQVAAQYYPDIVGATSELAIVCHYLPFGGDVGSWDEPATYVHISADGTTYTETNSLVTATTTTLTALPSPATVGQSVTLTATESPAAAGSVQFENGGAAIGHPVAVNNGVAKKTTTFAAAGTENLSAVFTPTDTTHNSGSTGTFALTVHVPTSMNSTTEAGYAFAVGGGTTTVKAKFTVPSLTCTAAAQGIEPFISLHSSSSTLSSPWLLAACSNGAPVYQGNVNLDGYNTVVNYPIAAGDTIGLSVTVGASGSTVTFSDSTAHFSTTEKGPGFVPVGGFVGIGPVNDSSNNLEGVPTFTKIPFSGTTLGGHTLASTSPTEYNRMSSGNVLQVGTSLLSTTGTAFTLTFMHT
jgi:hypothetical protein